MGIQDGLKDDPGEGTFWKNANIRDTCPNVLALKKCFSIGSFFANFFLESKSHLPPWGVIFTTVSSDTCRLEA